MFGCCVAGRLLQTNLQQIDETHALFEIAQPSAINHVCVFLLGTGAAAATSPTPPLISYPFHLQSPSLMATAPPYTSSCLEKAPTYSECEFSYNIVAHLLTDLPSRLSNEKPSAIFRLRGTFTSSTQTHSAFTTTQSSGPDTTAVLGLSIEPLDQIQAQISTLNSALVKTTSDLTKDPSILADRIVKHLFNYVSSFINSSGNVTPDVMVPMSIIGKWYDSFLSKVKAGGTGFLERGD